MRIILHDRDIETFQYLEEQIHKLMANTGEPITVDLTAGDIRNYGQNDLYQDATRYLAKHVAQESGQPYNDDVHTWMKHKCQGKWGKTGEFTNPRTHEVDSVLVSTTKYSKTEMCSLITCVLAYCGEIGVNVPIKGDYLEILESQQI